MLQVTRSMLLRYGVAVLFVMLALLLAALLRPWLEQSVFLLFFSAVMMSAWYSGLGPGLLATLLSLSIIEYYLLSPVWGQTIPRLIIFVLMSILISSLNEARKRSEVKQRSLTEALKQSNELKSALLASISHDLRTPLTSIRAAIDSLMNEEFNWDKATLRELHLIISEEVHRLTKLVENLLEMARIEAGELHCSPQWGSVAEICDNALEQCAVELRHHLVRMDCPENLPGVKVDARLIAEALTQVVENAAKYSPRGSEILVRGRLDGNQLSISVADQGPGIAREDMDRIFDNLYRSSLPNIHSNHGTGMGLAIARGMIKAHGGKIRVESTPGRGATFIIELPVEYSRASESELVKETP
jgi:two-component system sensor histidine kinase KdpD